MSTLELLKSEAATLEARERAAGHPIKHAAALEITAKRYGFKSWRALRASANRTVRSSPVQVPTRRYESKEWQFSLDIPERWNAFPAVSANSPYEVVRFASHEEGNHLLIVFRSPFDPKSTVDVYAGQVRQLLESKGFGHFAAGVGIIGSRSVPTLDFDKPTEDGLWSCRHYFLAAGTLRYTLGFGTNRRDEMFGLFDRMANSFAIQ